MQAPLSRLAGFGPRTRGTGFRSGLAVGAALGFVCAPCAGPILAAVTSVSASSGATAQVVAVALAYSIGLSAVLLLYALGGRAVLNRVRRSVRGHVVERTLGVVLLATGIAMAFNLDVRFEELLARDNLPAFLVDPTRARRTRAPCSTDWRPCGQHRDSHAPARGRHQADAQQVGRVDPRRQDAAAISPRDGAQLHRHAAVVQHFRRAAAHDGGTAWPRGPRRLLDLHLHQLPADAAVPQGLYATYHRYGLDVVGVETPEFTFERIASNVAQAIGSDGLHYPVVEDNNYGTWNAYQNQFWPAEYLIDAHGQVRHTQFGEGDYLQSEAAVRELLYEAGAHTLPPPMSAHAILPSAGLATPETYLGTDRTQGFVPRLRSGFTPTRASRDPGLTRSRYGAHGGSCRSTRPPFRRAGRSRPAFKQPTYTWS